MPSIFKQSKPRRRRELLKKKRAQEREIMEHFQRRDTICAADAAKLVGVTEASVIDVFHWWHFKGYVDTVVRHQPIWPQTEMRMLPAGRAYFNAQLQQTPTT